MSSIQTIQGLGLEDLSAGALRALVAGLNDTLVEVEQAYLADDESLDQIRGLPHRKVLLEAVAGRNFHLGNKPSLIDDGAGAMPDVRRDFPAVSVMAYRAQPGTENSQHDGGAVYTDQLYVEILVKASQQDGEEVCDKRIWRSVEAVHATLSDSRNLGGLVETIGDPTVLISEVFVRPESDDNSGTDWFWQAGRLEYGVEKYSPYMTRGD